ncbi:translational machinery component [Polyplosphaeria fusca]|uniref:Small ribosomal subunit protein uS11m n=1 Tax=Polyplosphaeria fusca TaxID=682080 RepID=A0A9P4V3J0_9PLEO|nr:translational machinery component [Polyplosphaeria fusca]
MSGPTSIRAFRSLRNPICASCRSHFQPRPTWTLPRPFSTTPTTLATETPKPNNPKSNDPFSSLLTNVSSAFRTPSQTYDTLIPARSRSLDGLPYKNLSSSSSDPRDQPTHHFHIYATKHNTHITLTAPDRNPLISVSCGNIGFRKAGRGSYDAAYQLAAFVMSRIQDKGLLVQIQRLEVVYRGFGQGREAVTKALLGNEGKKVRPLVVKLTDGTRLKFGGVRSPRPRRLG